MCGIAGALDRSGAPIPVELLRRMSDVIAHRGPDGEGQYADGPVGLANRRLAIIDPRPEGNQPMFDATGDYVITYNGELYNYRELRAELQREGRRFRTQTDTEVVLNAYAAWGPACVERFNGMFAFAIWNRRRVSCSSPVTATASSRSTTPRSGRSSCSARRSSRCSSTTALRPR